MPTFLGRLRTLAVLIIVMLAVALPTASFAVPTAADFASSSRLALGRWVRVKVSETGMQLVTTAQLKSQGLDPAKTHVYGFGGRMVPDNFPEGLPDDLPLLPSVTTSAGIVFFGTDHISWSYADSHYSHQMHPYCEESYYFLSDAPVDGHEGSASLPAVPNGTVQPANAKTTFKARLLHEDDMFAPYNSGRNLLGEDLRASARNFTFNLTDYAGGPASANIRFAAKHTSGTSSIMVTANGTQLPSSSRDQINTTDKDGNYFMFLEATRKTIEDPGSRLTLGVTFSGNPTTKMGRLDWIEVEYDRSLRLNGGELYFYGRMGSGETYAIEGCSADTQIWDVTNPAAPRRMEFDLSGSKALFAPVSYGYREFVAFNPSQVKRTVVPAGRVANQDIHSLPTPDMVIISPAEYLSASERLAEMHRRVDGMVVHVLTPEAIYNEFTSGSADVGAFRKMLKMWQVRAGEAGPGTPQARYCLIMSRPTYDNKMKTSTVRNAGYPRVPIWQSPEGYTSGSSYSMDDFIGMLDHNVLTYGSAKIHVAVGRLPVKSAREAEDMVTKIIDYVEQPEYGSWRNHVMLVADDQDGGDHLSQTLDVHKAMRSAGNGNDFFYDLLVFDTYDLVATAGGNTYPGVTEALLRKWNEGVGFINYIGHANPSGWSHEKVLTWNHINSFSNSRLPILYAATCEFARWDADEVSGGEIMLLNPHGGYVGAVIPSRTVYISANGTLSEKTMSGIFERAADGKGKRLGDVMVEGKNACNGDTNKLRYALLSDPALRICSPEMSARTEMIGDVPADGDAPVFGARGRARFSGTISGSDGSVADDFNGVIELTLYDAEVAITTKGNGKDGVEWDYNDRTTRLATESTVVKNGRWEANLSLPGDITNNYSPALLSLYAYSENGQEANGSCDNFYVYGYDPSAPEDLDGPDIERFTLNHDNFAMGDLTHSSPLVIAAFSDESGINVSNAAIGHEMTLLLDGRTYLPGVASAYTPDPARDGAGMLVYSIDDLAPGDHSLELKVWDNAGNSSAATIYFTVALNKSADIASLAVTPTDEGTRISLQVDRPGKGLMTEVEICDLSGRTIWTESFTGTDKTSSKLSTLWPHTDQAGRRVIRGIYICRAKITTPDGSVSHVARKIAVGAK